MNWIRSWREKPGPSFRPLGIARPVISESAVWDCVESDDSVIPEQVVYLAGDVAAVQGRIRVLQAHGIDVVIGLDAGIGDHAEIVIDAASFDAAWKYQRQIDALERGGMCRSLLILHRDRMLVCPVCQSGGRSAPAQTPAQTPALRWLMTHFRTRARARVGRARMPVAS